MSKHSIVMLSDQDAVSRKEFGYAFQTLSVDDTQMYIR